MNEATSGAAIFSIAGGAVPMLCTESYTRRIAVALLRSLGVTLTKLVAEQIDPVPGWEDVFPASGIVPVDGLVLGHSGRGPLDAGRLYQEDLTVLGVVNGTTVSLTMNWWYRPSGHHIYEGVALEKATFTNAAISWSCIGDSLGVRIVNAFAEGIRELGYEVLNERHQSYPDESLDAWFAYGPMDEAFDALLEKTPKAVEQAVKQRTATLEKTLLSVEQLSRRREREHARHIADLTTEASTQRAIASRCREDLRKCEGEMRLLRTQLNAALGASSTSGPIAVTQDHRDEQLAALQAQLEGASARNDELRKENYKLRLAAEQRSSSEDSGSLEDSRSNLLPETLAELDKWIEETIEPRIVASRRAISAAKKSAYANPQLLYRTLQAMHDHLWPMRFESDNDAKSRWEQFLTSERLSCGPTGAAVTNHRTAESYYVSWGGRRIPLDMHIQGKSSRDEARGFRLYFNVDTASQTIICGHFPTHLPNSLS